MNLTHETKTLSSSSKYFNNEIRDQAGGCFCGCHNMYVNGYYEFENWGSKYEFFSSKIHMIFRIKTNVIWKEANILNFNIIHMYWGLIILPFCIDLKLIFEKYQSTGMCQD